MDQDKVPLITDRYHKWLQKQLQGKGGPALDASDNEHCYRCALRHRKNPV